MLVRMGYQGKNHSSAGRGWVSRNMNMNKDFSGGIFFITPPISSILVQVLTIPLSDTFVSDPDYKSMGHPNFSIRFASFCRQNNCRNL